MLVNGKPTNGDKEPTKVELVSINIPTDEVFFLTLRVVASLVFISIGFALVGWMILLLVRLF